MVSGRGLSRGLAVGLSLVACNAIVGIEDPIVVEPNKPSGCLLNSDCADKTQVCVFQICSPPCAADRDCDDGARCLVTDSGQACVVSSTASCRTAADCPSGSVCSGGACRNACGAGCLDDQECGADGVCHGTDNHDPASTSGGSGGTAGAAGMGGSAGNGGTAGSATLAGAAGAAPEAGASGAGPGQPLCVPGHKRCADLVIQTCIDDAWSATGDCPYACVGGECTGECVPKSTDCKNLVPRTCSDAATWVEGQACAKVCDKGTCVDKCDENALQCSNGDLQHCVNGVYTLLQNCVADCVNDKCTECTPLAEECTNGAHQTCGADGTWGDPFNCAKMCVGNGCGVCTPNAQPTDCIANTPQYCDATGNFKPSAGTCQGANPICEAGKCVACTAGSVDCLDANTPRSCVAGQWQNGSDCVGTAPACLKGACVACAPGAVDCLDTNTPRSCQPNGTWKNGTDCTGNNPACLGGGCVQCTPNATPTHCASACTKTRQYCSAQGAWTDYATSCTGSDSCTSGSCALAAESQAGQYAQLPSFLDGLADNLIANRIQITCNADLLRLGARFKTAAGSVRFALYKDAAGEPTSILAGTASTPVVAGITEASASGVTLAPGYYWVVMNLSDQTAAVYYQDNVTPAPTRYAGYLFSTPSFPPTSFPADSSLPQLYDLYAIVRANP